jgi:hypothetical protein
MPISAPDKIITPWATSGLKATIPETADPLLGRAGFDQGFPAINMTPKTAGGIPPFGQDFNGIFFDVTQALQFMQAGGTFPYDGAWATAVGGYPAGALVSRTDNQGLWRNTVANNLTDPEAGGAGWQPEGSGLTSVSMASSNVTLTPLQAAREIIVITGALTANLQLIFPDYVKSWTVANAATGAFTVTCKTASGTGVDVSAGQTNQIYGDGTNILAVVQGSTDTVNAPVVTLAAAGAINLTTGAPNTSQLAISGTGVSINGFTVVADRFFVVTMTGATNTLVNSASLVTGRGANIPVVSGDSFLMRSTGANTVEIVGGTFWVDRCLGTGQAWQDVSGSRAVATNYTNTTGRPIMVSVTRFTTGSTVAVVTLSVDGVIASSGYHSGSARATLCAIVPNGGVYRVDGGESTENWAELRT